MKKYDRQITLSERKKDFVKVGFFESFLVHPEVSITIPVVLLFIFFSIASPSFLTAYNIFNLTRNVGLYGFVAIAQALVIVGGGMNLSIGAIGGLAVVATGYFIQVQGFSPVVAVIIALSVGLAAGALNGMIITKIGVNSFVATLATLFIFTGIIYGITKGYPYTKIPGSFTIVGRDGMWGLPYIFWLMIGTLCFIFYVFNFRRFGRWLLAIGGNKEAARVSGINVDRIILLSHVLSGLFAAVAGVLWVSRMGSAQPAIGQEWLIISFAAAIIGGTSLSGGSISAWGLLMGSIIIVLIRNGLILIGTDIYFEQTYLGLIVLLAVTVDRIRALYYKRE
ncbi:ABC transporter permease [Candidatus Aerophobetes bacterium]|nr:ABC transporter permease [Candidatus Aerophobetes bacterium]